MEGKQDYVNRPLRETGLTAQAVKIARRIQGLPNDCVYGIILVKERDCWTLSVQNSTSIERITE